jgi:CRISPR system Cascade subunit CasC
MPSSARFIDLHLIQTVPYANLNRDDLGSPKSVVYGGAMRTRVSSQCWKRAVRLDVQERLGDVAVRTRRIALQLAEVLVDDGWPQELAAFAGQQVIAAAGGGLKFEDAGETSVLLFLPARALGELKTLCEENRDALTTAAAQPMAKKAAVKEPGAKKPAAKNVATLLPSARVTEIVTSRNDVINLFGRMLAELPGGDVDGSVQVAHAFTTHIAEPEVDFFTAVDDWQPADNRGSGHMNNAEFSAGTFYRYASVNLADLTKNLGHDSVGASQLAAAFLDAFITSLPNAKKNSTAPFTVPDLAYISIRSDRPVSLAAAFETPVRMADEGGYGFKSREAVDRYAGKIYTLIGTDGINHHAHAAVEDKEFSSLGTRVGSYRALIDSALTMVGSGR